MGTDTEKWKQLREVTNESLQGRVNILKRSILPSGGWMPMDALRLFHSLTLLERNRSIMQPELLPQLLKTIAFDLDNDDPGAVASALVT